MQTRVLSASVKFLNHALITPMVLSSGTIREITEAVATVRVRVGECEAEGKGSILLSDVWAWPDAAISHDVRDGAMRKFCESLANELNKICGDAAHPLELGMRLHGAKPQADGMPLLASAVCASPFDAAIHDAAGHATNRSAFDFYDDAAAIPSADHLFKDGAVDAVRRVLLHPPKQKLAAWVIVNKGDDLDRVIRLWFADRGYRNFKIKLTGRNPDDVERTIEVFRAMRRWEREVPSDLNHPHPGPLPEYRERGISVDSNEANPDAASVLDYLETLRAKDAEAFAALKYLEQPTSRDIGTHAHDWRAVSKLKPVMLDEGLTDLSLLPLVREQGWSGLAVKTCKGHSFSLIAAAWARVHGLAISVQDLTNPGYAAIHSALLAAHLPAINDVELNSPQFIPQANASWLPRVKDLFEPRDGMHHVPQRMPVGLGSSL